MGNLSNKRKDDRLENLDTCLPRSLKELGLLQSFQIHGLLHKWKRVVGEIIARNTRIIDITPPVITISTFTSQWMQELKMQEKQIIKKINDYYGTPIITSIRLQMHRQSYIKYTDLETMDDGKSSNYGINVPSRIDFSSIPIYQAELDEIDRTLVNIESDELRRIGRKIQIEQRKKDKLLVKQGYHKCPHCGIWMTVKRRVCITCYHVLYRKHIGNIKRVIRAYPYIRYEQVQQYIKCSLDAFTEAKRECTYYFLDKVHFGSTNIEHMYTLAMMITNKQRDELEEGFVVNLCNKYRSKYIQNKE